MLTESLHSIVFTFWKKTLDILATALDAADIKYCRLDGSLTTKRRNEVLTDFRVNAASKVLIMTFSTGAIGYGACCLFHTNVQNN